MSARPLQVLVIGPRFGAASSAIESALTSVPEIAATFVWFDENAFSRSPLTTLISQGLRTVATATRAPRVLAQRVERLISTVRFDRPKFATWLDQTTSELRADVLVVVKPMLFDSAVFRQLQRRTAATRTVIYLWDALWRTPHIRLLFDQADAIFTTEPTDTSREVRLLPLPGPEVETATHSSRSTQSMDGLVRHTAPLVESRLRFFFCGEFSIDRLAEAWRLRRRLGSIGTLHGSMVSTNRVAQALASLVGLSSERMTADEYHAAVAACDVLVDLGRRNQSSPSSRVGDAVLADRPLFTTNPWLGGLGFPVVDRSSLGRALRNPEVCNDQFVRDSWRRLIERHRLVVDGPSWAERVLERSLVHD